MRKYSLYPFSMKLGIATDLWSEVAVLVMARQEIIKILVTLKVPASAVLSCPVHPCVLRASMLSVTIVLEYMYCAF